MSNNEDSSRRNKSVYNGKIKNTEWFMKKRLHRGKKKSITLPSLRRFSYPGNTTEVRRPKKKGTTTLENEHNAEDVNYAVNSVQKVKLHTYR